MSRFLPPSKVLQDVVVRNAIIGDGSNIKARSRVSNSIIGLRSLIGEDCVIEDTLMLGSDYYETVEECAWVPGERRSLAACLCRCAYSHILGML
jgi:glucose-1-phosphate adenylyltransferase